MAIKVSAAADIRTLVDALADEDEVGREAAIARLAVIGARAVERLAAAFEAQTDRVARCAILRALEPLGDPRAFPAARTALALGGDVALAAIGVLRGLLDSSRAVASLDLLATVALDTTQESRLRIAALDVLQEVSDSTRDRMAAALAADPDPVIRHRIRGGGSEELAAEALWLDVLSGHLPDDPRPVRDLLASRAGTAPLNSLQRLVDIIHGRENAARGASHQREWRAIRGAIHQALAMRGSRLALYDLRETLERDRTRLPPSFVAALQTVGDSSLLEAIASALAGASPDDPAWKAQLAAAFRLIAQRERVTRRHPTFRRIARRWPLVAAELGGAAGPIRQS